MKVKQQQRPVLTKLPPVKKVNLPLTLAGEDQVQTQIKPTAVPQKKPVQDPQVEENKFDFFTIAFIAFVLFVVYKIFKP